MRFRALRALSIGLLATTLVAGTAIAGTPRSTEATLSPEGATLTTVARKLTLGVSMLDDANVATYDAFTAATGRAPAIWSIWSDWGGGSASFPSTTLLTRLKLRGSVPMIIWQPVDPSVQDPATYAYARIIAGEYDAYITEWATAAKAWGRRVLIRFAHEMDGTWFPWSFNKADNTPAGFVAAWRHIWNIFRGPSGVGATNVRFLWSPMTGQCTCLQDMYPGNTYVDYVGFTAFNWGPPRQGWVTMKSSYSRAMRDIAKISKKPVIVAETGSSAIGGNKAAWIRDGYPAVYKAYPTITAIVYFNVDSGYAGQPDWRLIGPALTAYKKIVAKPQYQGKLK